MAIHWDHIGDVVIQCVIFTAIGLAMFGASFWIFERIAGYSIKKEIAEEHNVALGIVLAAAMLGIAMIVSAAIGG